MWGRSRVGMVEWEFGLCGGFGRVVHMWLEYVEKKMVLLSR